MKRYQYCSWYVKLWRKRYLIIVPYKALKIWLLNYYIDKIDKGKKEEYALSFKNCWGIAIGLAHMNMNWVYDMTEVKEMLKNKK